MKSILAFKCNTRKRTIDIAVVLLAVIISIVLFCGDIVSLGGKNIFKIIMERAVPFLITGADHEPESIMTGGSVKEMYMWPLQGTVTSAFGTRGETMHEGIDIAAPQGTPIYAYMDGTVIFSGIYEGYGNLIVLDHGNGIKTYYGHNSVLHVTAGQQVVMGQHISDVGSTGDSTGPHCHFEIRISGTPVDPLGYLK